MVPANLLATLQAPSLPLKASNSATSLVRVRNILIMTITVLILVINRLSPQQVVSLSTVIILALQLRVTITGIQVVFQSVRPLISPKKSTISIGVFSLALQTNIFTPMALALKAAMPHTMSQSNLE